MLKKLPKTLGNFPKIPSLQLRLCYQYQVLWLIHVDAIALTLTHVANVFEGLYYGHFRLKNPNAFAWYPHICRSTQASLHMYLTLRCWAGHGLAWFDQFTL